MQLPLNARKWKIIACLVLCLSAIPGTRAAVQARVLGVNDHVIWRTNAEQDVAFAEYAESDTKFIRAGADWIMESSKGVYNPRYLDRIDYFFAKCTTAGIRVLLIPAYAPGWANGNKPGSGYAPLPEHTEDYADFCEFLLRRYAVAPYINAAGQRTLEAIEIWNEPDLGDIFFKPYARYSAAGGTAYGNLVVAAGGRLKSVRAAIGANDVLICAPVISEVRSVCWAPAGQTTWIDAFYAVPGVTANYDVFSWHSYWQSAGTTSWLPPELPPCFSTANQLASVMGKLTAGGDNLIWAKMTAHGDNLKPNWLTEIGGAARSETAQHKPERLLSFAEQQAHLADAINVLHAGHVAGLSRVYWYDLFDDAHTKGDQQVYGLIAVNDTNPIAYNGPISLVDARLTPKPAYATYKNAAKSVAAGPAPAPLAAARPGALAQPIAPAKPEALPAPVPGASPTVKEVVGAHTGSGAAKAVLSGKAGWKSLFQIPAVTPQTDYTFSFWMKGTGKMRLKISPANWSNILAAKEFTATPEWTLYTVPGINTGANAALVYCLQDSGDVAGTVYLDDCFLGPPGGANRLANPGFENGGAGWTLGPLFIAVQNP